MMNSPAKMALIASLPVVLAGCQGVVWGNVAALGVTFCLFFGTLQLGRKPSSTNGQGPSTRAPSSATQSVHGETRTNNSAR